MKPILTTGEDNNLVERRSELIKSEIAKYRLLKSKGVMTSTDEQKEKGTPSKPLYPVKQSPAKSEGTLLTQSLSRSGMTSPNQNQFAQGKRAQNGNGQVPPTQSLSTSRRPSNERDKAKVENVSTFSPSPSVRDGVPDHLGNKSTILEKSARTNGMLNLIKNKSEPLGIEPIQEKTWSFIEDFVDTEIDKDLTKGSKTTKNKSSRSLTSNENFSKSQVGWGSKGAEINEKRSSSAFGMNGKNFRDKNYTPNSLRSGDENVMNVLRKSSIPDTSAVPMTEESQIRRRNFMTPTQSFSSKERDKKVSSSLRSPQQWSIKVEGGEKDKGLKEEVDKWRIFGKMMAESYDELNKKYTEYMKEKEKDKKIVSALKEQVNTLKALLKASKDENAKMKEVTSKSSLESSESRDAKEQKEIGILVKELEKLKKNNEETIKMVDFLKNENDILKQTIDDGQKYKQVVEHYQKLADVRFKECSALAEEIICLRTDLDRSHSNYLRIQREHTSGKKTNDDTLFSAKKLHYGNESERTAKKPIETKTSLWNEENDDEPPLPADLNAVPSKKESSLI